MKKKKIKVFPIIIFILALAVLGLIIFLRLGCEPKSPDAKPSPTPTPVVDKEPQPEYFTISLVGDNTIANANGSIGNITVVDSHHDTCRLKYRARLQPVRNGVVSL